MIAVHVNWSNPSTLEGTGVHHGYRTAPATTAELAEIWPEWEGPVRRVWWGRLDPGGFILPHVDASPWYRRWHYPLEPAGYVWHNDQIVESPSDPFEITHFEPHAVWNPTDTPRIHLLVESTERIPGESGLVLFPVLPEMEALVAATK